MYRSHVNGLVNKDKISKEDADKAAADLRKKCDSIVETSKSDELAAIEVG